MDKGHRYTDKQIELLERRLKRHYGKANAELRRKLEEYLKENKGRYEEMWRLLDEGEITPEQFEYLIMTDSGLDALEGELTEACVENDTQAMALIGAVLGGIYAFNNAYQGQRMQKKIGKKFDLIARLKLKTKRTLPPPNPDKMKDRIWHRVKIRLVVSDGIRKGRSVMEVSGNLQKVTNMDMGAAIRAARTACTNAENRAKLDAMYTLRDEFGVDVKKMWYATLDNRTRTEHRMMHGEVRELEETFSNDLQYPGDPDGDPGEVWNCRCTLLEVIGGIGVNISDAPSGKSREEWIDETPVSKPYPIPKRKR